MLYQLIETPYILYMIGELSPTTGCFHNI